MSLKPVLQVAPAATPSTAATATAQAIENVPMALPATTVSVAFRLTPAIQLASRQIRVVGTITQVAIITLATSAAVTNTAQTPMAVARASFAGTTNVATHST